jgi:hypothetical protein
MKVAVMAFTFTVYVLYYALGSCVIILFESSKSDFQRMDERYFSDLSAMLLGGVGIQPADRIMPNLLPSGHSIAMI